MDLSLREIQKEEMAIEIHILKKLNENPKGFFWKVEYPNYRDKNKKFITHPHPYVLKGMPDVMGFFDKRLYGFEIKTPIEHRWILKKIDLFQGQNLKSSLKSKNKKIHRVANQIQVMHSLCKQGGTCGFVSCYDFAFRLLNEEPNFYFEPPKKEAEV